MKIYLKYLITGEVLQIWCSHKILTKDFNTENAHKDI